MPSGGLQWKMKTHACMHTYTHTDIQITSNCTQRVDQNTFKRHTWKSCRLFSYFSSATEFGKILIVMKPLLTQDYWICFIHHAFIFLGGGEHRTKMV